MNSVIAVVVTYNRLCMLKKCLKALNKQNYKCDILVVDNNSSDGTSEWLLENSGEYKFKYLNTGSNIGGAGGFNIGLKYAKQNGYKFVWLMDDDCIPDSEALFKLIEADKELKGVYGWLSSKCLWIDGNLCPMNIQRKNPYTKIKDYKTTLVEAQMASFVSLFIKISVVRKYGLPIKEFFIWSDDWEYTRRISKKIKCYVVNNSIVTHAMKNNSIVNIATDAEERLERYKYFYRNDVYLYRREGVKGWIWLFLKDVWHTMKTMKTGKFSRIFIIWKGFFAGIKFSNRTYNIEDNDERK